MANKVKVKLTRSLIGATEKQKRIAQSLGATKMNRVIEHNDTEIIRGMINKIPHLVSIVE